MSKTVDNTSFYGYESLRKHDSNMEYTEEQIQEILKCQADPIYFIENYIKIITIDSGLVDFKLYDYQKEYVKIMHDSNRAIIKTPRQAGKTTTTAAYIVWYVLFNEHKTVGILAHQANGAREILDRIQVMYESLPIWLQAGVIYWSKGSFELDNGCKLMTSATDSPMMRGKTIALLYLDEIAFISDSAFEDFFASVWPTVASSKQAKVIMSSTPFGMNHFYKLWTEAVEGRNGFAHLEISWNDVPGRDEAWKAKTLSEVGPERWEQEYEAQFLGVAGGLIQPKILRSLPIRNPITSQYDDKFLIYEEPQKEGIYVVCVDPSEGVGKDGSAIQVLRIDKLPYKQVARFNDNFLKPSLFHMTIDKIAKSYNMALVIVESNSIGNTVLNNLFYLSEYENIFFEKEWGIKTTQTTKNLGCSELKHLIENKKLEVCDYQTIYELSNFTRQGNTYKANKDQNDDLVMPLVIFAYFITNEKMYERFFDRSNDEMHEINKSIIDNIEENLLPIGWFNFGEGIESIDEVDEEFINYKD